MNDDKITDSASSENFVIRANTCHFLCKDRPIHRRDAVAIRLTDELEKLSKVQEQFEFYESRIAKDRSLLSYLRGKFGDAGLDTNGRLHAGVQLLRTMNRVQRTLEESCSQLRGPD